MGAVLEAAAIEYEGHAGRGPNVVRLPSAVEDNSIQRHMRLTDEQYEEIIEEFHAWRSAAADNPNRTQLSSSQRSMASFLYYLAGGGYFRQTSLPMGIGISTAWKACQLVADFFHEISADHICLPTLEVIPDLVIDELEGMIYIIYKDR